MDGMATWTDGPEYAPLARPEAFVEPDVAPLSAAPDAAPPVTLDARPVPEFAPAEHGVPLDMLAPSAAAPRDPREPFEVVSTPMTAWQPPVPDDAPTHATTVPPLAVSAATADGAPGTTAVAGGIPGAAGGQEPRPAMGPDGFPRLDTGSAWRGAHASTTQPPAPAPWTPQQPFHPSAWPPPQAAPPPPRGQPRTVGLAEIAMAVTPGVLICLGVGATVTPLSLPLYLVAMALASRVAYRRAAIARAFSIGLFAVLALGLAAMIWSQGTFDVFGWYTSSMDWARWANVAMALYALISVSQAMHKGEEPDPR